MSTPDRRGGMLVQKMFELDSAYRQIKENDRKYRQISGNGRSDEGREDERDREIVRLRYMVSKLEERLQVAKVETENAKRELKNEQDGRKVVDKKIKAVEKDNKDMRQKMSALRVKLGVANANYNVGKHETEELRKNHQENQIQIARLEERLAAANSERERLKNPDNPDGSQQVQRKLEIDKKESKKLKNKIEKLENLRKEDKQIIDEKEEENRMMATELNMCRMTIENLETSLEMAEMTIQAEKVSREDFERQNYALRQERENFDSQIKHYKVKLGISQATKNVNVRQAVVLRKKDEDYQYTIQSLEHKLRLANAEIERLKTRNLMTGKTADSLQDHRGRLKKYRNNFGMEFHTPRPYDKQSISGWSTSRMTPKREKDRIASNSVGSLNSQTHGRMTPKREKDRISSNSVGSLNSQTHGPASGKRGRTSAP